MSVTTSFRSAISCAIRVNARSMPVLLRMIEDSGMRDERARVKNKTANLALAAVRWSEIFLHVAPWRPRRVALKVRSDRLVSRWLCALTGFAPLGAMADDPVRERTLKADIVTGLLGLDPLVFENLFALRLEFPVQRGVLQQIAGRRLFGRVVHIRDGMFEFRVKLCRDIPDDNSIFWLWKGLTSP
jgi:hypothetical protein